MDAAEGVVAFVDERAANRKTSESSDLPDGLELAGAWSPRWTCPPSPGEAMFAGSLEGPTRVRSWPWPIWRLMR